VSTTNSQFFFTRSKQTDRCVSLGAETIASPAIIPRTARVPTANAPTALTSRHPVASESKLSPRSRALVDRLAFLS
jgi:hypothetical protein